MKWNVIAMAVEDLALPRRRLRRSMLSRMVGGMVGGNEGHDQGDGKHRDHNDQSARGGLQPSI
jgi:hypothetical protein